jgi:hypothetical protein
MDGPPMNRYAQAIRDFFSILFGSKLVVQLRADLEEAKKERDFFRAEMQRYQMFTSRSQVIPSPRNNPAPGQATKVGSRRRWAEIQAENTERNRKILEEQAAKAKAW